MGIFVALSILVCWFLALGFGLVGVQLSGVEDIFKYLGLVLIIQFLYVGLFITVHDACHSSVAPGRPQVNLWIGRIFAALYAGLSFDRLKQKHLQHHQFSGTDLDPDFHPKNSQSFFFWLLCFFKNYITFQQVLIMCIVAQILMHGFSFAEINVFTFWVAPSLLSSLQLFYFGTYLPHRKIELEPFSDNHHTRNSSAGFGWSLLSCYNFGAYHLVHHKLPSLSWFQLPAGRK
jgi:beta-carotene ketolase (CrtW type)